MDVTIRVAEAADAATLAALHLQVWQEAYAGLMPQQILDERAAEPLEARVARWRGRIALPGQQTWVAEHEHVVGFTESGEGRDGSGGLELMALYVRRSEYGTGLGDRLLEVAVGDRPAYLWVLDGNARAIRFYQKHGFTLDGQVKQEPHGLHRRMVRG